MPTSLILLISVCLAPTIISVIHAGETKDAFIVTIYDQNIKVVSPPKLLNPMSVIIENKTLSKIVGKLEIVASNFTQYLSIPSESMKSVKVVMKENDQLYFVPMAPAFQEVHLGIGGRSYEIPTKE